MCSACAGCRGQIGRTDTAPDLRKLPSDWEDGHGNRSNKNGNARTITVSIDREKLREQKKPTSGDPDTGGSGKASRRRPSPERRVGVAHCRKEGKAFPAGGAAYAEDPCFYERLLLFPPPGKGAQRTLGVKLRFPFCEIGVLLVLLDVRSQ